MSDIEKLLADLHAASDAPLLGGAHRIRVLLARCLEALSEAQRDAERIPREPTEAMLEACRMVDNGSDGTIEGQRQRRICNWRAMYDAAIAERAQEGK